MPIFIPKEAAPTMGQTTTSKKRSAPPQEKRKASPTVLLPSGGEVAVALFPMALAVWYFGWEASDCASRMAALDVAFPALTELLVALCLWCGAHHGALFWIAGGLLAVGFVARLFVRRYFLILGVAASILVGFTWYTIAAPVERLINNVEQNLPKR